MPPPADWVDGPTFVLVHSPLVGPITWAPVAEELRARGHDVAVAELTDDGDGPFWRRHAESGARAVSPHARRGRVTLVGHSGAGPLLPLIAEAADVVPAGYVFVDAGLPPRGRSRLDMMQDEDPAFATELHASLAKGERFPAWSDDDLAEILPDAAVRSRVLAELTPRGLEFFEEPIPTPDGWPDAPCAYIQLSAAYDVPAEQARRLGWPFVRLDGGHFHMLVDPASVVRSIVAAAATPAAQ